jgi:predicted TIM-barrel fold metal-dependent hydrolase
MSVFQEPKIDCHAHVFDPACFPYGKDIDYKPSGQEIGTPPQFDTVMKTYGVSHALLVQPNSGYGSDNSCMLDTIARGNGRFKGVAIVALDADLATLRPCDLARVESARNRRRGFQPDLPRQRLLQAVRRPDRQARRTRHVPANPERARPAVDVRALDRSHADACADRPLLTADAGRGPAATRLSGAAAARRHRAGQR